MRRIYKIILNYMAVAIGCIPVACPVSVYAALNDRLLNRPYADNRPWHLGFGFGVNAMSLNMTHTGQEAANGEIWYMEQPAYSPGFSVCGMASFRLNDYFSIRMSPGMYFGSRDIKMLDSEYGHESSQNIKSTFVVLPVDVKYAGMRFGNVRPYVSAGVMPAVDVSKKRTDMLKLKSADMYLTVALGGDFYLPYFKLIPELKFCFGLSDVIQHDRPDLADNPEAMKFTQAIGKASSNMVVLTFYFE